MSLFNEIQSSTHVKCSKSDAYTSEHHCFYPEAPRTQYAYRHASSILRSVLYIFFRTDLYPTFGESLAHELSRRDPL